MRNPVGACAAALLRLSTRPGDTAETLQLKRTVGPVYLVLGVLSLTQSIRTALDDEVSKGPWFVAMVLAAVALWGSLSFHLLGSLNPRTVLLSCISVLTVSICLMDWELAAGMHPRTWSMAVLILDCALVAEAPARFTNAVTLAVCLWLVLERAEATAHYGLYEVATYDEGSGRGHLCNCEHPPCAIPADSAVTSLLGFLIVFLTDLHLTRGFATGLRAQMRMVDASVEVSEQIATLLAEYSVEGAQRVVNARGEALPPALRSAYQRLLFNLVQYRPYLPDALLFPGVADSESATTYSTDTQGSPERVVPVPGQDDSSANVAICFTDIQQSTVLWEAHPQGMYEALQLHNTVLRRIALAHSGYEVKTIGDSFMLAFSSAVSACRFSLTVQEELLDQEWSPDLVAHPLCAKQVSRSGMLLWHGLRVRAGIHCGAVRIESNPITGRFDYHGPVVNTAARVESVLRLGGLVGCTGAVVDALSGGGLDEIGAPLVRSLGLRELRGVRDPIELFAFFSRRLAERASILSQDDLKSRTSSLGSRPSRLGSRLSSSPGSAMRCSVVTGVTQSSFDSESLPLSGSLSSRLGLTLRRHCTTCATIRVVLQDLDPVEYRIPGIFAAVEQAADASQGTVMALCSGSCIITWNSSASHTLQFQHFFSTAHREVAWRAPCYIGAATGALLAGNVAAGRRRFTTVIGGCVELSTALAEEAELCDDAALTTGAVGEQCAAHGSAYRAQLWRPERRGEHRADEPRSADAMVVWGLPTPCHFDGRGKWDSLLGLDTPPPRAADDEALHRVFLQAAELGGAAAAAMLGELQQSAPASDGLSQLLARAQRGALFVRAVPPVWEPRAVHPRRGDASDGSPNSPVTELETS